MIFFFYTFAEADADAAAASVDREAIFLFTICDTLRYIANLVII